jgi:hypothetical protein
MPLECDFRCASKALFGAVTRSGTALVFIARIPHEWNPLRALHIVDVFYTLQQMIWEAAVCCGFTRGVSGKIVYFEGLK